MTEQNKQTAIARAKTVWFARRVLLDSLHQTPAIAVPAFACAIQAHDAELDRLCKIDGVMEALLDDMAKEMNP